MSAQEFEEFLRQAQKQVDDRLTELIDREVGAPEALRQAMANGADCGGAWVARYLNDGCTRFPDWDDAFVTPAGGAPCPILIWQYAGDCCSGSIDCSQTNPELDPNASLLQYLALPPVA